MANSAVAVNNRKLLRTSVCILLLFSVSCARDSVDIYSYILRDRVIVTDRVLLKKALYVAFSITAVDVASDKYSVNGQLFCDGQMLSEVSIKLLNEKGGNLVFDLPYEIPDGLYTIKIDILDDRRGVIAEESLTVKRDSLKSVFYSADKTTSPPFEEMIQPNELEYFDRSNKDMSTGYLVFRRSPLEYIYPGSKPKKTEIIDSLSVRVVRNEFEPVTFALYPIKDLGNLNIAISDLHGIEGRISRDKIDVGFIEAVQETYGLSKGKYKNVPALIRPGNRLEIEKGKTQRFWLTLKTDKNDMPGAYKGAITITPQYGEIKNLPLEVIIEPITLEDIPDKDYFMLMTYEFAELAMPWNDEDKEKIYKSATNILMDYREHGLTTLCLHSPFILKTNDDGTPNLEDIFAALLAARDTGFTRPIIWYMGHLIQTSKPKHPGSILGFEKEVHLERLNYLVDKVTEFAKKNNCPDVIFFPIDEADDSFQDVKGKRFNITAQLLKSIKRSGAKNMVSASKYDQFKYVDYFAVGKIDKEDIKAAHRSGSTYWVYNNKVTVKCRNPAYARYIYGYYTWKNKIDGMSSWTFQNTQNASGHPMKADSSGRDLYLAYPDPEGPLATLKWEAVREGIDDHKLIYQLEKRMPKLKERGIDTSEFEKFLGDLRDVHVVPGCQPEDTYGLRPSLFQSKRNKLISMILNADKLLISYKKQDDMNLTPVY